MADVEASKVIQEVVSSLLVNGARMATKYLNATTIVRATRKLYKHQKRQIWKSNEIELVIKIGRPNYSDRDFIKLCKKSKEPFPVKKVQLKFPPKKK